MDPMAMAMLWGIGTAVGGLGLFVVGLWAIWGRR